MTYSRQLLHYHEDIGIMAVDVAKLSVLVDHVLEPNPEDVQVSRSRHDQGMAMVRVEHPGPKTHEVDLEDRVFDLVVIGNVSAKTVVKTGT